MVLASGLYFRERSSTLYTVIMGLAAGRAAKVNQLQQSSKVLVQLQAKQQRSSGSAVPALGRNSRHISAIICRLIVGITAQSFIN